MGYQPLVRFTSRVLKTGPRFQVCGPEFDEDWNPGNSFGEFQARGNVGEEGELLTSTLNTKSGY